jgi:hypothetical protein
MFRLLARLRQIANDNEKVGDEERTLARLNLVLLSKKKRNFSNFSLIWLGSCARAIPIVCKNLKNSLELVTNVNDSTNSPSPDRYQQTNIFLYHILPFRKVRGTSQPKRSFDKVSYNFSPHHKLNLCISDRKDFLVKNS